MKNNTLAILPPKTQRSKTPPMPLLSMLHFSPSLAETENKQLKAMNDKLAAENSRLVRIMLFGMAASFFCGLILGVYCKVNP